MERAGQALADVVDKEIAKAYLDATNTIGTDASPINITANGLYDQIADMAVKLDEANVPAEDRFLVIPMWAHGHLLKSDDFTSASALGDEVKVKGFIGEVLGFKVYKSNNVPNTAGTKFKILGGHPMAITFAEQIVSVEGYRPEARFSDAVKGLHVFGIKVVQPSALVCLTANKA